MNFVAPESLIFWTTAIFIVFFFLLRKFAWKPILGAVKSREESINSALASAQEARKEMENLKSDNERILKEARVLSDDIVKEAREIREKMISDAKEMAQKEGDRLIQQAKDAIQNEKRIAMSDIKTQISAMSLEIAEKLLREQLSNKESQVKLVENMLADVKLN